MNNGAFARYHAGDEAAAYDAVSEYGTTAYAAAFAVLRDSFAAETVAAEIIAEGLAGEDVPTGDTAAERVWVAATARANAIAVARASRKSRIRRNTPAPPAETPREAWLSDVVDSEIAMAAFESLPIAARDALSLAYGSGMQPSDVGRRVGFSADETREVLREGLIEMQHVLAGEGV